MRLDDTLMKSKTVFFILILIFVCTSGCSGSINQSEPPQPSETATYSSTENLGEYFPLTKGSFWKYLGDGNEFASFTREVIFTDGPYAQYSENNGGTVSSSVYYTTADEITCIYFKGEEYNKDNLIGLTSNFSLIILKSPLEVGNTWTSGNRKREITSINASVSTPLGEMSGCIEVKVTDENSFTYEYFKKNIGMVKREFHSGDIIISSTLEEMKILH